MLTYNMNINVRVYLTNGFDSMFKLGSLFLFPALYSKEKLQTGQITCTTNIGHWTITDEKV